MPCYGVELFQGDDLFDYIYDGLLLTPELVHEGFTKALENMDIPESQYEGTLRGFVEKRAGNEITPGSASFE